MNQQQGTGSVVESQATETAQTLAVVQQFCDAFNRHDLDAIMAFMTDDCVLESLYPYPDGTRYEGATAVRARWAEVFRTFPDLWYETEEMSRKNWSMRSAKARGPRPWGAAFCHAPQRSPWGVSRRFAAPQTGKIQGRGEPPGAQSTPNHALHLTASSARFQQQVSASVRQQSSLLNRKKW